jgi:tetraacyldisaccharide 4'-kinase
MSALRLILLPLSFVYYIIISVRNILFDINILRSKSFSTPVISVGNITTGGTGKTPLVIYLTDYLISKGKSVGVISRGYKSKSSELVVAYDGKCVTSDVKSTGDELSMIVNRFSGSNKFYAIAHSDRVKAINVMIDKFSPDVIILDDAFQNRRINKSLDIVITDKENTSFLNKLLIPAGNLRETSSSLKRADIVFNNYKFSDTDSAIDNVIRYSFRDLYDDKGTILELKNGINAIAISGIANNTSFHNALLNQNINIIKKFEHSDHYNYTSADIETYKNDNSEDVVYLTTEKDFIKIREFRDFVTNYPVYYLRIDVILNNGILENLLTKKNII